MATPVTVTDASFDAEVLKSDLIVVTDFWAEWSSPCQKIAPILDQLATEFEAQVKVAKLDIDTNPTAVSSYAVLNVPTVIVFKNGQPVERLTGPASKQEFVDAIKPYLN